jgi:K+-sensing histidine kinase KdpD
LEGAIKLNINENILVCITQQKTCERLIRKAAEHKNKSKGDLFVIHVAKNESNFLDNAMEGEALEYLFGISKSVGASLSVLRSDNIVNTIVDFSNENKIGYIVLGESPSDYQENHFFIALKKILNRVEFLIIPQVEL